MSPDVCENCGQPVPGHYCGNCGQRLAHSVHSFWHFVGEATEDLTHADSRLWLTLQALMFKPGFLTREFLEGRRVRYLPPVRLYLVLSVLFFVALGTHSNTQVAISIKGNSQVQIQSPDQALGPARPGETPQQHAARVCEPDYHGPAQSLLVPFFRKSCEKSVTGDRLTIAESFMHNVARAMFLFLPALALVMKGLYRHPPRYFVEHLLFFVHTHAFAFVLLGVFELVSRFLADSVSDALGVAVWLYIAYYVYAAMRCVYGQGKWRTFVKLTALAAAYLVGFCLMMLITGVYSVMVA